MTVKNNADVICVLLVSNHRRRLLGGMMLQRRLLQLIGAKWINPPYGMVQAWVAQKLIKVAFYEFSNV